MTLEKICEIINLPQEVTKEVLTYVKENKSVLDEELQKRLAVRDSWDSAVKELQEKIGEDVFGFGILAEMLAIACKAYDKYIELGIDDSVFIRTMEFCTRFINNHKKVHGHYAFTWAWWFVRQLAMQEFRIGELEFEFVEAKERFISIHIPGDVDFAPEKVQKTFEEYRSFLKKFFPEWIGVSWRCESWMLSPALEQLLDENSNVLQFNHLFEVESVDYDSMAVLDWVYPGESQEDLQSLSENTSLQKKMKQFLLDGGKVGWAKGRVK